MKKLFSLLVLAIFFINLTNVFASGGWDYEDYNPMEMKKDMERLVSESVGFLAGKKILEGYGEGNMGTDIVMNRAEFLKSVVEMAKYPDEMHSKEFVPLENIYPILGDDLHDCFPDVYDEWFAKYVCYAKQKGFVRGYEDGYFHPERPIILAEAAKILANIFLFYVTSHDIWYRGFVEHLSAAQMIPPTVLSVDQPLTRGEAAVILYRTFRWGPGSYFCPLAIFTFKDNGAVKSKALSCS